ncbi:hypothetical protein SAM23877_6164 [Streptomyces ambofaciens ATCC 23877]|uniref:Uncharacterized protein n=1 Tax=Streptomyces ambofaciens (strain ATCC 23877 / 3486 / DSM 40053 / JCM 4204 / NBRC 12836 / NRRL B-2516) TaxID=278992 RepID=A0A0K2B1Q0_STRA7|nr:hypothetical protein [Streptomyces ambofaciens]AKZ59209.1 hypothetical protein SAM23877_6164 [Streptomyces ambofaciens ATCC 23877]WNA15402.1 hypothetical protein SAMYPH_71 [Streptomyces phage Samy]
MTRHTLRCRVTDGDYAEAHIDADGDVRLEVHMGQHTSAFVYGRPTEFAAFARAVLAGTGESVETLTDGSINVGDRVEILPSANNTTTAGRVGVVSKVDRSGNDDMPYRVDDEAGGFIAWATRVRKISSDSATSPRADFVSQARAALDGTNPTAADIVRLAEFLAG